jgi:DNA-binding transcriptional LysR family regulator
MLGDTEAIKHAIAAGMGASILSRFSVGEEVSAGRLKWLRIKGVELRRPLQLLYPRGPARSYAVDEFLALLRSRAASRRRWIGARKGMRRKASDRLS